MKHCFLIIKNEWNNFKGNDPGLFAVYGIIIAIYSILFASNMISNNNQQNIVWWIFFSVVATGSFSGSVLIVERLKGSFEILLTCGISRNTILLGKVLYMVLMSIAMGLFPFVLSRLWVTFMSAYTTPVDWTGPVLYVGASFTSASCASWLGICLANPRLVHFVNLLLLSVVVAVHYFFNLGLVSLFFFLCAPGVLFLFLGMRAFASERVIQPVSL
ncbi:MAG: hypothetical protein GF350_14860 [Chitinivibrionales bacterium]|nr:hypothetical protein [Chitinivibrionales bacterium]